MIAYLEGRLNEKTPDHVVVLVGGVGYKVLIPVSTYYELPGEGESVALQVHTHVREDTLALYGFFSAKEKLLFHRLIGVAGVGPSLALKVMSGLEPQVLIDSIRRGDRQRLNAIPGVGKKTAERLILELRDKMPELAASEDPTRGTSDPARTLADDLVSALLNLGFARPQSEKEVESVVAGDPDAKFEDALKNVLRKLSG
ncbi:MAG: Holliday junction branch migration protein RuvA [Acidobacteriota bacterium]|nr:MAG: Holliday junction branch migration protein RuvA [Acidobacteriota bacterium]